MRFSLWILAVLVGLPTAALAQDTRSQPNVVLIMSDDQGYGDVGWHGNPIVRTPRLDALAKESAEFARFYVSPVCAPTRSSLLTGRYGYRTRVVDTYQGRAMMDPAEVTLAEYLGAAGYRCGIFGKWHLGDNAPMRPQDQGFQESLVHRGGGISQPSDPAGGSSYFDPILVRNGKLEQTRGYCSDVYTDAAIDFMSEQRDAPYFVYLAFNAPHVPLEVPKQDLDIYIDQDLTSAYPPGVASEAMTPRDRETIARVYGMVTNIDTNVGRVLDAIDSLKQRENTLVIFLTDNGPQQARYTAGLRGLKGSVYEGGIRVPNIWHMPGKVAPGRTLSTPAAHIDVVPTVLDACGIKANDGVPLDGRSLWGLLTGGADDLADRPYFVQWHRGDVPEAARACAVVTKRWKAAQPLGVPEGVFDTAGAKWELYDLDADPHEAHDLATEQPERVAQLREQYLDWFRDVSSTRGFEPPRIAVGDSAVELTPQDWRAAAGDTSPTNNGHWLLEVKQPGHYLARVRFAATAAPSTAVLSLGGVTVSKPVAMGESEAELPAIAATKGAARLDAWIEPADPASKAPARVGVRAVLIERVGD